MKKRYAIVRVDGRYEPSHFEVNSIENISELKILDEVVKEYGDTKEQLVAKVAQVFFKRKLKSYKKLFDIVPNNEDAKQVYKYCLETAKEIVEFLGVEE